MSSGHPGARAFRCGHVAIVGSPNVGKSTLLNRLLGEDLAIVTPRPQTTRDRVRGVRTLPGAQIVLVDTPGVCEGGGRGGLARHMAREAAAALGDVDVVVVVCEATAPPGRVPSPDEARILERAAERPLVLALNKIDRVPHKPLLLPLIERWSRVRDFAAVVPIAAREGEGVENLLRAIVALLPEGAAIFGEDELTDRPERFLVAEKVREQVFLATADEVPYAAAVTIDRWQERADRGDAVVEATIHLEKESQRGIVVGKGGAKIREIGTRARAAASRLLGRPIHLKLWVRVTPDWASDESALRELGYGGES